MIPTISAKSQRIATRRDKSQRRHDSIAIRRDLSRFITTGRRDRNANFFLAAIVTHIMSLHAYYL